MPTGAMLEPGAGQLIAGGPLHATLKVSGGPGAFASTFEVIVPPGYDVGAHVHTQQTELFYVLDGELDLLAFEPVERTPEDWHSWTSSSGETFLRGGPGSVLAVPAGCPHAFANFADRPATMLFQAAPAGHENYFRELAALLQASEGAVDQEAVADLRRRYDIQQLTPMQPGRA